MTFVLDSFTDAAGTSLTSHVGEVGAAWTSHSASVGSPPDISATNELQRGGHSDVTICYASGIPGSADYEVSADFRYIASGFNCWAGIFARLDPATHDGYVLQYEQWMGARGWVLYSVTGGSYANLASVAASAPGTAVLRVEADAITVTIDGTPTFSVTNSDHAGAGRAGVRFDPGTDNPDSIWLDNFTAAPVGTGPQTISPGGIDSTATVGAPEIDGGLQTISPPGVPSSLAVSAPRVSATQYLTDVGAVASTATVGPLLRVRAIGRLLAPAGIASTAAVGAPALLSGPRQWLRPPGIALAGPLGIPALSRVATAPVQASGALPQTAVGTPLLIRTFSADGEAPRNYLIDPVTHQIYPWPLNHSTEDAIKTLGRRLQRSGVTRNGRLLMQPTHPGSAHLTLRGSMLDRQPPTQYHTFVEFFRNNSDREFVYIDASRDAYRIIIVSFDAQRKQSLTHADGSYLTYSLEVEIKEAITGPLKEYV